MDAIRILGDLLSNRHVAPGRGKNVLEQIMGGAGATGHRPAHKPRAHAPSHRHAPAQSANSPLGGLIRAAAEQYGRHLSKQASGGQRQQAEHHDQQHDHQRQHEDHQRQQRELQQLEQKRRQLEQEQARLERKHQRDEKRHAREEQRHHQQEQGHGHRQPAPNSGAYRFPDDRDAANYQAQLLIRAMVYASKADGRLDQNERKTILSQMGYLSPQEKQFLEHEFARNISVCDFAREVPPGLEDEVYAASLTCIDLDTNQEARYLHELSHELELSHEIVNYIHQQVGARPIYS